MVIILSSADYRTFPSSQKVLLDSTGEEWQEKLSRIEAREGASLASTALNAFWTTYSVCKGPEVVERCTFEELTGDQCGWRTVGKGRWEASPHREARTSDGKQWEADTGKGHDPVRLRKKEGEGREEQTSRPGFWVEQLAGWGAAC